MSTPPAARPPKRRVDGHQKSMDCKAVVDFQEITEDKSIDAVCIATPDHWHAVITISALNNGKDVYCEKPLTHNVHESIEVMKAVEANRRVLQTGSMQRSMASSASLRNSSATESSGTSRTSMSHSAIPGNPATSIRRRWSPV